MRGRGACWRDAGTCVPRTPQLGRAACSSLALCLVLLRRASHRPPPTVVVLEAKDTCSEPCWPTNNAKKRQLHSLYLEPTYVSSSQPGHLLVSITHLRMHARTYCWTDSHVYCAQASAEDELVRYP